MRRSTTAQTPSADIGGVEAGGLVQVLHDPRTSLAQSLHALLTDELSDHAGWETLVALAQAAEQDAMAANFRDALNGESRHLALVRAWYEAAIGLAPAPAASAAAAGTLPPKASAIALPGAQPAGNPSRDTI